jgi:putative addiction module component (TIGR02574 family)
MLIVEEIWDSSAADQELMEVPDAQKKKLDRRLAFAQWSPGPGQTMGGNRG